MNTETKKSRSVRIFQNFGYLTIGKLVGDIFTFALFVTLTRTYGQEGIGQYSFAMALTGFFSVLTDFGLYHLSIKDISRNQENFSAYLGKLLFSRIILSLIALAFLILMLYAINFSDELKLIILIIGVYQIIYSMGSGFLAVFIAKEKMYIPAIFEFTLKSVIALIGIILALKKFDLEITVSIFPLATFVYVISSIAIIIKYYEKPSFIFSISRSYRLIREAVPYAFMLFLHQISTRIDVIFLGFILGVAAAGIYNTAYRIIFMFLIITNFVSMAILPVMSRLYIESKQELIKFYNQSLNIIILIGVPAAFGLWLIAPDLITLLYGNDFVESVLILRLLSVILLFVCIHQVIGTALTASDKQTERTKCQSIAAICNVIGNACLIPTIGVIGAAIATVISEAILVVLLAIKAKPILSWPHISSRLTISVLASMAFFIPMIIYDVTSIAISIPISILIYSACLFMFSDVRKKELSVLNQAIKSANNSN